MNVGIGNKAAQFQFGEYKNWILFAEYSQIRKLLITLNTALCSSHESAH